METIKKTRNKVIIDRKQAKFNRLANRVFIVIVSIALGFIIGSLIH